MYEIRLRNFRNNDLAAVSRLTHLAFSDPALQEGGTPAAVMERLRSLRRGRMRLLIKLLRYKLEMIVAEVDGNLAGYVMVTGRNQMNMNTLMVDPQYRRAGIGVALLEETFQRIHSWGYSFATAEVLAINLPSAKLCEKIGFEVYDTFNTYESALPLSSAAVHSPRNWVTLRPVQNADLEVFVQIERHLVSSIDLQVRGSAASYYFPSLYRRLVDYRTHKQSQSWTVEKDGRQAGFQYVHSNQGNPKGTLSRPMLPDGQLNFLPSIVKMAGDWFSELGKNTLRLDIPANRPHLMEYLSDWSWRPSAGWLCLVKWLNSQQ